MNLDQFAGHTPAPWAPVEIMAFAAGFTVEDAECRTVARIMKTRGGAPLPARANAALIASAPELLAEVRRLTAEADELRRERDELAAQVHIVTSERDELASGMQALRARLAEIEEQEPVAWIEHELQGTGLRHLHFERRPNTLRDDVVAPVWTALIARPACDWPGKCAPARRPGPGAPAQAKPCRCRRCLTERGDLLTLAGTMIVCPTCGNKRCPHATDHRHACTGSNEPGQTGSWYGGMPERADSVDWRDDDTRGSVINMWQCMLAAAPERAEIKQHPPIAWLMTAEGCDGSADWVEIGVDRPAPVEGFTAVPLRRY